MKKWTVMLIPHDRGERRSFDVSGLHAWALVALFLVMCFISAFFYQRNEIALARAEEMNRLYQETEEKMNAIDIEGFANEQWEMREAELRAEYENRDFAITAELSRLYDLESEVRIITGLPPHEGQTSPAFQNQGGQGGPPGEEGGATVFIDDAALRPPHIIYGLASPSADMMLQEIALRATSLERMLVDMKEQEDRIARMPSIWPSSAEDAYISSRFGYRKDPFTRRVRRHSGVDVAAWHGTPITATARGTVIFSGYEQYLGHAVKIDHGYGVESWYGHMSKRLVEEGDTVERGELIGKVGSTGRATGPHIHYEIHVNGQRVDPQKYLGQ